MTSPRHTEDPGLSGLGGVGSQADEKTLVAASAEPELPTGELGQVWVPQWTKQ